MAQAFLMRLPWTFRGSCVLVHIPRTSAAVGGLHAEPVWLKHFESHPGRAAFSSKSPGHPRRLASVRTPSAQTSEMGRRSCRHGHLNADYCQVSRQLTSPHRVLTMHSIPRASGRLGRRPGAMLSALSWATSLGQSRPTAESWPGGPWRSGRPPAKRQALDGPGRGPLSVPSEEHRGLRSHRGPDFESFHLLNHSPRPESW